jgi:uncharacterized membrane protein YbhN (UPF0104 family)
VPWKLLVSVLCESNISNVSALYVYCKSNLFKYAPGNFMHYIGRNQLSAIENISMASLNIATVFEIGLLSLSSVIVALIFNMKYALSWINSNIRIFEMAVVFAVLVFVLIFLLRSKISGKIKYKLSHYKSLIFNCNFIKKAIICIIIYSLFFIFNGIMLCILFKIQSVNLHGYYFKCIGMYSLSWLAGYITPGVPGGIGIREAMMTVLFESNVVSETIVSTMLIFRIINIIGDVFAYILLALIYRITNDKRKDIGKQ